MTMVLDWIFSLPINCWSKQHTHAYPTYRDQDGHYQITGRMDDVINVTGHRLGTAEVEDAMVSIRPPPRCVLLAATEKGTEVLAK